MLCLPAEPANTSFSGGEIDDQCRPAADAVAVEVEGVLECEQGLVRDRFH